MHLFWAVLWSVPLLALFSGPDCPIQKSSSSNNVSPLLQSLQCHNDYSSTVYCKWREQRNKTRELWIEAGSYRTLCVPDTPPVQDVHGTVQCRCEINILSIGIDHTAFFFKNESLPICSSYSHQRLTARPPVDLSTHDAGDGGRWISWSSPYKSSSSLNKNLTYQLRYRTDRQDNWTTEDVTNTSMKLEKQLLLPGHRYEAKVRARASVGQWSDWSPVVTWQTEEDTGQPPSLHCVLDGEREVMCSWEVSGELADFIVYQLACRNKQTESSKSCCDNPTVSSHLDGKVLKYSCSLTNVDPAHLLLELQPTRNAKIFMAHKHIQPKPPEKVEIQDKGSKWTVQWTDPNTALKNNLYYQVCYYRKQDQNCSTLENILVHSLNIPAMYLDSSQPYQVKIRSLIMPGSEYANYDGIPSEWTEPVEWISHPATWSFTTFLYCLISVFVAAVFLTLYCTFPTCRRKVVLWVESVPSPGKSKILSEIKSTTSWTLMQSEDTSICKVLHFDSVSTCSSDVSLWPTKETDKKHLEPDEGFWNCDNLPTLTEKVNSSDTSSLSFSGPYILCQTSPPNHRSADAKSEEKEKEEKTSSSDSSSPVNFALYGPGYVCLPSRTVSRSTQDLVSHSDSGTNTHMHNTAEQERQCPDTALCTDKMNVQPGFSEPISRDQPPAYTSEPFSPWPPGRHIQASGYCFLPQPK